MDWHPWGDEAFEKAKREDQCSSVVDIAVAIGGMFAKVTKFTLLFVAPI